MHVTCFRWRQKSAIDRIVEHGGVCRGTSLRPIWLRRSCVATWMNVTTCLLTTWLSCIIACWPSCWPSTTRSWRFVAGRASKQRRGSTLTVVPLDVVRGLQRHVTGGRVPMPTSYRGRGSYRCLDSCTRGRTAATGGQRLLRLRAMWRGCGEHFTVYLEKLRMSTRVNLQLMTLTFSSRTKWNPCAHLLHPRHFTTSKTRRLPTLEQWTTVTSNHETHRLSDVK